MVHLQQWFVPRQFRLLSPVLFRLFSRLFPFFCFLISRLLSRTCFESLVSLAWSRFYHFPMFYAFSILQFSGVAGFSGVQKLLASLMSLSKLPRKVDELVKTSSAL